MSDVLAIRRLVIDCATPNLSLALFEGDKLIASDHRQIGRGHAEALVPAIAALPDGGRAGAIYVGCGPGSFTGIRIGIAAARALAFAWGAPLSGFDTLALIAAQARRKTGAERIAVAVDGGHGEWFVAEAPLGALSLKPEDAAAVMDSPLVGGARAADLVALRGWGEAIDAEADAREFPFMDQLAIMASAAPLYGRAPDAKVLAAT